MKISWPKIPTIAIFVIVFLLFEGLPGPAPAQSMQPSQLLPLYCAERTLLIENLYEKYEELPTENGVTPNGMLVEVLTSKNGESFTILLTKGNGTTCMLATGNGWRVNEYDDGDEGPEA